MHADYDYDEAEGEGVRPDELILGYHVTKSGKGDLEVTFATQAGAYDPFDPNQNKRLTSLLREGKTDPCLAAPASFRSRRLYDGGTVLFTCKRPFARPQLHDFRTHSSFRSSKAINIRGE